MESVKDGLEKILANEKRCMEKWFGHNASDEYKWEYDLVYVSSFDVLVKLVYRKYPHITRGIRLNEM